MVKKNQTPAEALAGLVEGGTAKWAKQRKAEERHASARLRRDDVMTRARRFNIKEAAEKVLPEAYLKASAGGTLPANPRQIYYAARSGILELTGKYNLGAQYFCQRVLVDFIEEHDFDWDLVWDDRGHFLEPHTARKIGLGTLAVRDYLAANSRPKLAELAFASAKIDTHGPSGRFGGLLFIEKEGFMPLFEKVKLAERYDIAIMSSKGMSVTAARMLADRLCGEYDIPLFALHDFDIAGFSIMRTVGCDTRRYTFEHDIDVRDIGLRLDDVERLGLDCERVAIDQDHDKLEARLEINGADDDEIDFLLSGRRVELNAMTSDQFVIFIEEKLEEHGVAKVIPDEELLAEAYRLFRRGQRIEKIIEEALAEDAAESDDEAPGDLADRVRDYLAQNPKQRWDDAIAALADEDADD